MQIGLRKPSMEGVVHEGWLVKSPPEKRLLKAKWRQRWFVLRHSGLLPGQYILEYFTDNSCRKLKGKIDLDHCDQVDVGSTCETKKTTYQFMFDIITPKRTYYLVAETEAEMNKWVDCICTVGGLKLYVDEGAESIIDECLITNPLSMISKGLLSSTTLLSAIVVNNNYLAPQEPVTSTPSTTTATAVSNLIETKSSSNPYIPISECHTGKPVPNGDLGSISRFNDLPKESPPPPPIQNDIFHERSSSAEFYDYPRPINPTVSHNLGSSRFGTVHRVSNFGSSDQSAFSNGCKTLPPRVNWNSHPVDGGPTTTGVVLKRDSVDRTADASAYDIVPPLHSTHRLENLRREVQDLATEFEKTSIDSSQETLSSMSGSSSNIFKAPPRPPKPSNMRERHDYENFEPLHLASIADDSLAYDIPPSAKGISLSALPVAQPIFKKESIDELSASTKVPLSLSVGNENLVDDTYDFPKFRSEDNINVTVPTPHSVGSSQRPRRHAYTNAPPGLFNNKELIFNYEYRPSLMTDYVNMDNKQETSSLGDLLNVSSSTAGPYANIPNTSPSVASSDASDTPPAVNRELKPKKSVDKGSFSFLTLQPPPLYKMRANKCSFRSEKYVGSGTASPTLMSSLNGTPPVPNRFRHQADLSATSEDDFLVACGGSRRGSTTDDQARHHFSSASCKKDEIQYLDLDLDSEPSPSPKSPERISSTVYKKVDFVKTEAFNKMRQNVEENYRKSQ